MKKEAELQEKLAAWDQLEAALEESEKRQEKMKAKYDKFKQVFDDGLVKKNNQGLYEAVEDPNERALIKEEVIKKKRRKTMTAAEADITSVHLSQVNDANDDQGMD